MPRTKRVTPGGIVFRALNRAAGRLRIFSTERDHAAFEGTIEETLRLYPMRILSAPVMLPWLGLQVNRV